jgi:hypothetical protein
VTERQLLVRTDRDAGTGRNNHRTRPAITPRRTSRLQPDRSFHRSPDTVRNLPGVSSGNLTINGTANPDHIRTV